MKGKCRKEFDIILCKKYSFINNRVTTLLVLVFQGVAVYLNAAVRSAVDGVCSDFNVLPYYPRQSSI
jgi:hypothetical protein